MLLSVLQRRFCGVAEIAVERRNDLRALADGAADAFDRSGTHIPNRKHAGTRFAVAPSNDPVVLHVRAGQHEPSAIEVHAATVEPTGRRIGANKQKQVSDIDGAYFAGQAAAPTMRSSPASSLPSSATTSVLKTSSIFGVASIPRSDNETCWRPGRHRGSP